MLWCAQRRAIAPDERRERASICDGEMPNGVPNMATVLRRRVVTERTRRSWRVLWVYQECRGVPGCAPWARRCRTREAVVPKVLIQA